MSRNCDYGYRVKRQNNRGRIIGVALMTGVMLLWNYFLTPLYQGWPRQQIAEMLASGAIQ